MQLVLTLFIATLIAVDPSTPAHRDCSAEMQQPLCNRSRSRTVSELFESELQLVYNFRFQVACYAKAFAAPLTATRLRVEQVAQPLRYVWNLFGVSSVLEKRSCFAYDKLPC